MQRMMLTYAQTVGEAALDDTDNAAEVPTELDQLCKTLIRYAPEKKPRKKRMLRPAALAAAVLAVLLAGMIAVQAAGVNLFGVRARWNDDILNITPDGKDNGAPSDRPASQGSVLDAVLAEQGFPLSLGPSEIPAGYVLSELKISGTDTLKTVYACYTGKSSLIISTHRFREKIPILSKRMPKRRRCTRQRTAAPSFSCVIRTGGQARGATEATPLHFGALKQESS